MLIQYLKRREGDINQDFIYLSWLRSRIKRLGGTINLCPHKNNNILENKNMFKLIKNIPF